MAFIFAGISALYAYKFTGVPFRYLSLVLGAVTLVMIPAYIISPHNVSGSISGMLERLIVYPYFLWLVGFGSYLASPQSKYPVTESPELGLGAKP